MKSRKSYRRVAVKDVSAEYLRDQAIGHGGPSTTVGLDIGKEEILVVVRWGQDHFERPWLVSNPNEIGLLIERLTLLRTTSDHVRVALESTGTYGEAVRRALTEARFDVHRVSTKAASDYAEIFDGVPSKHDGKDAAILAELTAFGKSVSWPFVEAGEEEQQREHDVLRMDAYRKQMTTWTGRLEGLLAKHWPELTHFLDLSSPTLLEMLKHYGSPADLLADPRATERFQAWSKGLLKETKILSILASAKETAGVPASAAAKTWLQEVAGEALSAYRQLQRLESQLKKGAANHAGIQRLACLGVPTVCVLFATVGDPDDYDSAGAYLKALGLNLKERSSGKRVGELAITKRGPSAARRWLFYLALRSVQRPEIKPWYEAKKQRDQTYGKMKGLVGVMRKLARAIWHVSRTGEAFDWGKVFPGRPLACSAAGERTGE